jgi:histidinol dehydrogenase
MTVVPAQVAGVSDIVVVAPPTPFGADNPDILAVCHELGVREVYRVGGAQAIAALAYGLELLPRVDFVAGPGNLFVALAKKYVFGECGIDSLAGPSEIVVIADDSSPIEFVAADLLAQAEHAPGASLFVTWVRELAERLEGELEAQCRRLARGELARQSLAEFGAIILVRDSGHAVEIVNSLAPEHLHVVTRDAHRMAERLHTAGAVFLGPFTPVALGDYVAGPSHVLPTGGSGRWASGLSANSFRRSYCEIEYTSEALRTSSGAVQLLAQRENLSAHAESISVRSQHGPPS